MIQTESYDDPRLGDAVLTWAITGKAARESLDAAAALRTELRAAIIDSPDDPDLTEDVRDKLREETITGSFLAALAGAHFSTMTRLLSSERAQA